MLFYVKVLGVSNPQQGPQHPGAADAAGADLVSGQFVSIALLERAPQPTQPGARPPERSTFYDGTPQAVVEWPSDPPGMDATLAMTIEAWVYREDAARLETILSHDAAKSYWFGFNQGFLQFQRGPAGAGKSSREVRAGRWTHVAAAYDGSRVQFFIDGDDAGSASIKSGQLGQASPLRLGGDPAGFNFHGYLDEVRVWWGARTQAQIRAEMFNEVRTGAGLALVFPAGGAREETHPWLGTAGNGVRPAIWGILPRFLVVPKATVPVAMDGKVATDTEYLGAEQVPIRYGLGDTARDAMALLVYRDQPDDQNLYVAVRGLRDVPSGRSRGDSWFAVSIDANGARDLLAQRTDLQFGGFLGAQPGQMWVGDGEGGYTQWTILPGPTKPWEVAYGPSTAAAPPDMEFRIARDLFGQWTETDGLMLGHFWVSAVRDDYLAPPPAKAGSPATWAPTTYGDAVLPGPPDITASHTSLLFGNVPLGESAERRLTLGNRGETALQITGLVLSPPVFRLATLPPLPLTLAAGASFELPIAYTPPAAGHDQGRLRILSNDPDLPELDVFLDGAGGAAGGGCDAIPLAGVSPVITITSQTSPANDRAHIFGDPISFTATDAARLCGDDCYEVCWYFRRSDQEWIDVAPYRFTPGRLLGCDRLIPLPGDYEVKVKMCGAVSPTNAFSVILGPGFADQVHPVFEDQCYIDWNADAAHRLNTAHFNVLWNDRIYHEDDVDINGDGCNDPLPALRDSTPRTNRLGLLECAWATLDYWMTSPLDPSALFRNLDDYAPLTHLTYWVAGPEGGGVSQPLGIGYGQGALANSAHWVPLHELFHTFDYAGNPLHNKGRFDYRTQGNPYVFFHEAPTRVAQTMASNAFDVWGFNTERWPVWTPLDMGQLELGYDGGVFWAFVMNAYPFEPRLSWEGPSICACAQWADPTRLPHNFELFELWNARVRERIREELTRQGHGPNTPLTDYDCTDNLPPRDDDFFIYNGHVQPACHQSLEYELAVLEEILRERFEARGTPLAESLLLDFAVNFATNFPPLRLGTQGMPTKVSCANLAGLGFSQGFADTPDALTCLGDLGYNTNDFYARIRFRILDASVRRLRLSANDEATLYVDGLAVIEPLDSAFPNASTTYADQRSDAAAGLNYIWSSATARPRSSIVAVSDPTGHEFEIEWVNRGDGKGNNDVDGTGAAISRYFLSLESCDSLDNASANCTPVPADQIEILAADFWPKQGSGAPGFASAPDWNNAISPTKEIQLRPVSSGDRPFFLPPLAVHYHPVESPLGYSGPLSVSVRHDGLTHTRPSAHLLVVRPTFVEWLGPLEQIDERTQRIALQSCGNGEPATYDGSPAVIVVVARRTLHGFNDGPAQYGTLGALHYTVSIPQVHAPIELKPDRYERDARGRNNDTLARATPLPNKDGGDVFGDPGNPPTRIWEMVVPDLTLHDASDRDYFCLNLPEEAGDDCRDQLPDCDAGAQVVNGILEITVRDGARTVIVAYDQQGNEIGRGDHYLPVACPRERGLGRLCFAVFSEDGCATGHGWASGYYLTIRYSVPDEGAAEKLGRLCIGGGGGGGGGGGVFGPGDFARFINPLKAAWQAFVFDCNPIVCQGFKHDYLLFHWANAGRFRVEFEHRSVDDFEFALLDDRFNEIAQGRRGASLQTVAGAPGGPLVSQNLELTLLQPGYYALRVRGTKFPRPYWLRFATAPPPPLRIDPSAVSFSGSNLQFRWAAEPGKRYRVQYKVRLADPAWLDATPDIVPSGLGFFNAPVTGARERFFRVVQQD